MISIPPDLVRAAATPSGAALIGGIVDGARRAGALAMATGVEHGDVADVLVAAGVEMLVGFHIGRPELDAPTLGADAARHAPS